MDAVVTASVVSAAAGGVVALEAFSLFSPQPANNAIATPATNNPLNSFTVIPPIFYLL
ncbi:hypothetical protein D3C81_1850700 [compost metagenome]